MNSHPHSIKKVQSINQAGLTIVEMMISIAIAAIMITVFFTISIGFFGTTIRSQVTAEMAVDSHFMLRAIIEDLRVSDSISPTNLLTDANAPSGGWVTSDADNVLVLERPATTSAHDIIYDEDTGSPYNNEYIYYISNNTLYKRLLRNDAAVDNVIYTSCPEAVAVSGCSPDRKYSSYVTDMTLIFYDANNNVVTDVALARTVKVGLNMSRRVYGTTMTFNNSILTKLRN